METEQTSHRFSAISPNHKKLMNSSEKKVRWGFLWGKKKKHKRIQFALKLADFKVVWFVTSEESQWPRLTCDVLNIMMTIRLPVCEYRSNL